MTLILTLQACSSFRPGQNSVSNDDTDSVDLSAAFVQPHTIFDEEVTVSPEEVIATRSEEVVAIKPTVEVVAKPTEVKVPIVIKVESASPSPVQEEKFFTYFVQNDDNLSHIAKSILGKSSDWKQFIVWNDNLKNNPSMIRPGMKIRYPASIIMTDPSFGKDQEGFGLYIVKKKDTLEKIARKLLGKRSDWKKLHAWNQDNLYNPHKLRRGMKIRFTLLDRLPASTDYK